MAWLTLPIAAGIGGTVLQFAGGMSAASAAERQGQQMREAQQYKAAQLESQATQAVASSQREAQEQERRARLVASRALAVSAASGAGASDPTIEKIISDIDGEGAYRSMVALYQGEERARTLRMGADAARYEGDMAVQSGEERASGMRMGALGSLAAGGAGLYARFGMGGPQTKSSVLDGSFYDKRFTDMADPAYG